MYCPECGVQYREGYTECSDCKIALVDGAPPPEPHSHFDPKLGLTVVLETDDGFRVAMAKGLLEQAGIPFFVLGQITRLVNDVDPFLRKWVRVQVPSDREAEARELLEELEQPVTEAQEEGT